MRILLVCSGTQPNFNITLHQSFIYEQIEAVRKRTGLEYELFIIKSKGILGYLRGIITIHRVIRQKDYSLIHAHYGLCGFVASTQRKVPVVVTCHNGETLNKLVNLLSSIACLMSAHNIFVAEHVKKKMYFYNYNNYSIIPCGIDTIAFQPNNTIAPNIKNIILQNKINIIFGGSITNKRKNYDLLLKAVNLINRYDINIIELRNYSREEVNALLNFCNVAVLPSISEGSPQFIKEAMACNCPIVATDVGDNMNIIAGTRGCYLSSLDPNDFANKLDRAIEYSITYQKTNGRMKIMGYSNEKIAEMIFNIYTNVVRNVHSNC